MNPVEVDLVLLREVTIWRALMSPPGVLVASEGLKSKSDRNIRIQENRAH
jgi:hypothetical protein